MSRKVESVSFNLDDPYEKKLHDHATAQVFSKYVKRLIDADMMQKTITPILYTPPIQEALMQPNDPPKKTKSSDVSSSMKDLARLYT